MSLQIPKRSSEVVILQTDKKGQRMIQKTLHRKLKIKQPKPTENWG